MRKRLTSNNGLTKRQVCAELRKRGWVKIKHGWQKPINKPVFSLRAAATFEFILARESLS